MNEKLRAWECKSCVMWFWVEHEYTPKFCPECGKGDGFVPNKLTNITFERNTEHWEAAL